MNQFLNFLGTFNDLTKTKNEWKKYVTEISSKYS